MIHKYYVPLITVQFTDPDLEDAQPVWKIRTERNDNNGNLIEEYREFDKRIEALEYLKISIDTELMILQEREANDGVTDD